MGNAISSTGTENKLTQLTPATTTEFTSTLLRVGNSSNSSPETDKQIQLQKDYKTLRKQNFFSDFEPLEEKKTKIMERLISSKEGPFDLKRIRLTGQVLSGGSLAGSDLSGSVLERVKFIDTDFRGAKLNHIYMLDSPFIKCDLTEVSFKSGLYMRYMLKTYFKKCVGENTNFKKIKLIEVKFIESNFDSPNFYKAKLKEVYFDESNIIKGNFKESLFKKCVFSKTNLKGSDFESARLVDCDFSQANLNDVNFMNVQIIGKTNIGEATSFKGTNFSGTYHKGKLKGLDLRESKFKGKDCSEANFFGADLEEVSFEKTKLTESNLTKANINKANFKGANLEKANVHEIYLPDWNERTLDLFLNHINNHSSFLTAVDSIDDQYVKLSLVHQLIDSLDKRPKELSFLSVTECLLNILCKEVYYNDEKIKSWVNKELIPDYILKFTTTPLLKIDPNVIKGLLDFFSKNHEYMFTCNGLFIQLISHAVSSDMTEIKDKAINLYDIYLKNEDISQYTKQYDFGENEQAKWSDNDANNFILVSPIKEDGEYLYVIIISQNQLQSMLGIKPNNQINWNSLFVFKKQYNLGASEYKLDILFKDHFKIFESNYQFNLNKTKFSRLLDILNLGDLDPLFRTAIKQASTEHKLTDYDKQEQLSKIFLPQMQMIEITQLKTYHLTPEFLEKLIQVYDMTQSDKKEQAETLLCLSAVFARFSSSAFFGTEGESPNLLRFFACALMEEAYKLSPEIFIDEQNKSKNYRDDWRDKLLGDRKNTFTCTAVLSYKMVKHINNKFPSVLSGIMPLSWT